MRCVLVAGTGGAGTTTVAAATAVGLSAAGHKTLVLSADPSGSLGEVLGARLDAGGAELTEVDDGLFATRLDRSRLLAAAWSGLRIPLGALLGQHGVDRLVPEELTALPGFEELLVLSEVYRVARGGLWDAVVVDCGATAQTLRLLALPEGCARYLEALLPAHLRAVPGPLGGAAGSPPPGTAARRWDAALDAVDRLAEHLVALQALLTDPRMTSARLVLTADRVAVAETRRSLTALALQGVRVRDLVVNRLVPPPPPRSRGQAARWMRAVRGGQEEALAALRAEVPGLPLHRLGLRESEPLGVPALRELGGELVTGLVIGAGATDALRPDEPPLEPSPALSVTPCVGADLTAEYELWVTIPLTEHDAEHVELARVDDDLAIAVGGHRRLLPLPPVLRRCTVLDAQAGADGLRLRFRPDPLVRPR